MKAIQLIILLLSLHLSFSSFAKGKGVAKVIILKGEVKMQLGKLTKVLKKGEWLPEGAIVATASKSFCKLLFIDKSSMNVGPKSQMKITAFPRKKAGIITLMKGQIRSKVTKNYMQIDKKKSKLFIKTKSAAMGVRGTDFQVNYNPTNQATSLITFSGAVAMAKLDAQIDKVRGRSFQDSLEKVVSSKTAVMVTKGQYSGASPKAQRATIPVKISPVQLETIKKTEAPGLSSHQPSKGPKKQFRSLIPPGVDSKSMSNESKEADVIMSSTVSSKAMKEVKTEIRKELTAHSAAGEVAPPEGMVNTQTGEIAPTAGGYVDLKTAQYIPPPAGSAFDSNTGVYIPPTSVGYINPETGSYANDHYDLTPEGKFVSKSAQSPEPNDQQNRGPASVEGSSSSTPPPAPGVGPLPTMLTPKQHGPDGPDYSSTQGSSPPSLENLAESTLEDTTQGIQDDLENTVIQNATKAIFRATIAD